MDRRQFQHLLTRAALAGLALPAWAQTAKVQPEPVEDPTLVGLRAVLETAARDTFDRHPDAWPEGLGDHVRERWTNWQRYGPPRLSEGSPWTRYEAFESLARFAAKRLWAFARDDLLVQVHKLTLADLDRLRKGLAQKLSDGAWATVAFERSAFAHLHHRMLGTITEMHRAWLLENRDRYPRNPAARHAQIEAEDWEVCSRVTRALCFAIFDTMAEQERRLRQNPSLAGTHVQMKAVLTTLGPAPSGRPVRANTYGGAVKDPLQPR